MRGRRRFLALCLLLAAAFASLGIWQLERRTWKLAKIDKVAARVHAPPILLSAVPPSTRDVDYLRVQARGVFRNDRETLVQALTELGAGWWVLTPLNTDTGTILVNRGFVPADRRDPRSRIAGQPQGIVTVTGLLRESEPKGAFLRNNDPAHDRWYSRDVAAIAQSRHLGKVAPFFLDADATPNPGRYPVGGLTVIQFRNSHLAYALTWFGLSALSIAGAVMLFRSKPPR